MRKAFKLVAIIILTSVLFVGCKKDDDNSTSNSSTTTYSAGKVTLDFTNIVGTKNLDVTGTTSYTNEAGNAFTVSMFKYYISNVKLVKADGTIYNVPESYYLINEADQTTVKPEMDNIPGGLYSGVKFTIGVDSARNVSGVQTGALDPANGMFWSWSTGYIFLKFEGNSPASNNGSLVFHIGGFKESNNTNALREVSLDFGKNLVVNGSREAEIHILADVLNMFKGDTPVDFAVNNFQMLPGGFTLTLANNCQSMFTFDHLHND